MVSLVHNWFLVIYQQRLFLVMQSLNSSAQKIKFVYSTLAHINKMVESSAGAESTLSQQISRAYQLRKQQEMKKKCMNGFL